MVEKMSKGRLNGCKIMALPDDVFHLILRFFNPIEVVPLENICQRFAHICKQYWTQVTLVRINGRNRSAIDVHNDFHAVVSRCGGHIGALDLEGCQIQVEMATEVAETCMNVSSLKFWDCGYYETKQLPFGRFFSQFPRVTTLVLKGFCCYNYKSQSEEWTPILVDSDQFRFLANYRQLTHLLLDSNIGCFIRPELFLEICDSLYYLKALVLSNHSFCYIDDQVLAEGLSRLLELRELSLDYLATSKSFYLKELVAVTVVSVCTQLRYFRLSDCELSGRGMSVLANAAQLQVLMVSVYVMPDILMVLNQRPLEPQFFLPLHVFLTVESELTNAMVDTRRFRLHPTGSTYASMKTEAAVAGVNLNNYWSFRMRFRIE